MNLYRFLEPGETIVKGDFLPSSFDSRMERVDDEMEGDRAGAAEGLRLVIELPGDVEPADSDPEDGAIRLTTNDWRFTSQWVERDRIPGMIAGLLAAWQAGAS